MLESFERLKEFRLAALEYWLSQTKSSRQRKRLGELHTAVEACQNVTQLGVISIIPTPNSGLGFPKMDSLLSFDPTNLTCFQFGSGPLAWQSFWGRGYSEKHKRNIAFVLVINKIELAPSVVLDRLNQSMDGSSALWSVSGGVADGETWYPIPFHLTRGTFKCRPRSTRFVFQTEAADSTFLKSFRLESTREKEFKCDLTYKCYPEGRDKVRFSATFSSAHMGVFNGDGGCAPLCRDGVGIRSWSYPLMRTKISATFPHTKAQTYVGQAWFDHIIFSGDFITNGFLRWIANVILPDNQIAKWISLQIQLDDPAVQWFFQRFVSAAPTFGMIYDSFDVLNTYSTTGDRRSFKRGEINFTLEVLALTEVKSYISEKSHPFPSRYKVGIWEEDTTPTYYILKADCGPGERYAPNANINVAVIGSVWNIDESQRLGTFMTDFHQMQPAKEGEELTATVAGMNKAIL